MTILLNHTHAPGWTIAALDPSGTIVKAVDADLPAKSPRLMTSVSAAKAANAMFRYA